jgi:AcrR family transcriptional regulator
MLIKRKTKTPVRPSPPPPAALEVETARMSGDERRRQLIKVSMRLFSQKGFTGTTTKEIAAAQT